MLHIAVCDDSFNFLQKETQLIEQWSRQSGVPTQIYSFDNGEDLIAKIHTVRMDIIFLDIIMPLQNGIEIAKEIRRHDNAAKIVFLTSSGEFALESYGVKSFGLSSQTHNIRKA